MQAEHEGVQIVAFYEGAAPDARGRFLEQILKFSDDELESIATAIPGPRSRALAEELARYEAPGVTYLGPEYPVFWESASGALVNDADGNPVDIAAIVVWQIADTAQATFAVENVTDFVTVQAESALRHVARSYPYDGPDEVESLRGSTDVVSSELAEEVAERVSIAGVEVLEVRISHLAYSAEIAQAMLQRQQAAAVIAARTRIVEGAVSMVQMALEELTRAGVVELDEERRAAMVSNLLVVLCGDSRATPVVNAGTLYS